MASYKGITFAKGYDRSFADFKKEFASTHIFKGIPTEKKEAELKKAYKVATNGKLSNSARKSEKDKPESDK